MDPSNSYRDPRANPTRQPLEGESEEEEEEEEDVEDEDVERTT